jgi:hypothetical protein
MMMRYLGLGVGHMQPPDFPREDNSLQVTREHDYIPPSKRQPAGTQPAGLRGVTVAVTSDGPNEEAGGEESERESEGDDGDEDLEGEESGFEDFGSDSEDEGDDNPVLYEY